MKRPSALKRRRRVCSPRRRLWTSSEVATRLPNLAVTISAMAILVLVVILLVSSMLHLGESREQWHSVPLENRLLQLHFRVDYEQQRISFVLEYESNKKYEMDSNINDDENVWLAFGFSDNGDLVNADVALLWTDHLGHYHLNDGSTDGTGLFRVDDHDDFEDVMIEQEKERRLVVAFSRAFDTCDDDDYLIEDGTTHVVWSVGRTHLSDPNHRLNLRDGHHDFTRTRLLRVDTLPSLSSSSSSSLEVSHSLEVPSDSTTYWCSVHRLPAQVAAQKHHVIQYEPKWTRGSEHLLHHMELFHCQLDPDLTLPLWQGPCGSDEAPSELERCKQVLAAWAIGAEAFVYPEESGLALGGRERSPYVMLEVHFNNEQREQGVLDHSGLRLHLTKHLRKHDAGILELGLIYGPLMAIPPGLTAFPLTGFCPGYCTANALPADGIVIFGSQLHTHATGVQVATKHIREGVELEEINRDNHYSTHFQEIRNLHTHVHVQPGDDLLTICWYDTQSRANVTLNGYGFQDEMCVNYVHYYPRVDLEICKSAVDQNQLQTFFKQQLGPDFSSTSTSEQYGALDFHESRDATEHLFDLYNRAGLKLQCQSGNGLSMVKYTENVAMPRIDVPLINGDDVRRAYCDATAADTVDAQSEEERVKRVGHSFNEMRKRSHSMDSSSSMDTLSDSELSELAHRLQLMEKLLEKHFGVDPQQALLAVEQELKIEHLKGEQNHFDMDNQSQRLMRLTKKALKKKKASKRPYLNEGYINSGRGLSGRGRRRAPDRRRRTRRDPPAALQLQLDSALQSLNSPRHTGAMHLVRLAKRPDDLNKDKSESEFDDKSESEFDDKSESEYDDLLNASDKEWADYSAWGLDKRGLGSIV